jgi:hypothetical protein
MVETLATLVQAGAPLRVVHPDELDDEDAVPAA